MQPGPPSDHASMKSFKAILFIAIVAVVAIEVYSRWVKPKLFASA